ncbi:NTF2 fold immunity protein [Hymenobacter sp. BT491]|uniref:NTF2 fold immunity protein n=1 Tax=Hymenobacter sp. BT491 TaxID=2766779 RepID=UPI001653D9B7|nr:NTF2 fold immunity protein [Hymenobacter sp. BT491]MBC6989495.1 YbbC/YhhH family protein [Hymenobacter sp. BT491]
MLNIAGYSQNKHSKIGKQAAQEYVQAALNNPTLEIALAGKLLIKDSTLAIHIAEPILFSVYGQKNIVTQRPYEMCLFDKYWVLRGTLPKESDGGVFLIIIDARNGKVIQLTHGK